MAEVGGDYKGDIALDDISVTPGSCPGRCLSILCNCLAFSHSSVVLTAPTPTPAPNPCARKCKNGACVDISKVCDFTNDCGVGDDSDERDCASCTFEKGNRENSLENSVLLRIEYCINQLPTML